MADAAREYGAAFFSGLKPDRELLVSEWANEYRFLSPKSSAEPGRYRMDRTPYLREPLDCLAKESPVQEVVMIKGAQVGASEAGLNWMGYVVHQAPAPTLMVLPTIELAQKVSKQRIAPMIEVTPVLKERVKEARSRDSGNTVLLKEFPGGFLIMTGANSGAGLRSMPAKNVFLDEVDAYPVNVAGEGSPIALARKRTSTFPRRKIFMASTPLLKHASLIEGEFESTDKRYYFCPCPFCDHMQPILWKGIEWDRLPNGKPDLKTVRLKCEACSGAIKNHHKTRMLSKGEWRATAPDPSEGKRRGYHLSALYSPVGWFSWEEAVDDFDKALRDDTLMQAFLNTTLGETYEVKAQDAVEWKRLYDRREGYELGVVPAQVCLLTAATDVQKDRLEVSIWGWRKKEAWVVDHLTLIGETTKEEVWKKLDDVLYRDYRHAAGGTMRIRAMTIDTGYNTTSVYDWVRRQSVRLVFAIKGRDDYSMPIGPPKPVDYTSRGKRIRRGVRLSLVGTNVLKSDLYGRLRLEKPTDEELAAGGFPPRFVHFPMLGEEYFKQLTAEQMIMVKKRNGQVRYEWVKLYQANEALDTSCYNIAAFYAVGAHRWDEGDWGRLAAEVGAVEAEAPTAPAPPASTPATAARATPVRRKVATPPPKRPSFW